MQVPSFLLETYSLPHLVYTGSLQMKSKARRRLVAGPRSHRTQTVGFL